MKAHRSKARGFAASLVQLAGKARVQVGVNHNEPPIRHRGAVLRCGLEPADRRPPLLGILDLGIRQPVILKERSETFRRTGHLGDLVSGDAAAANGRPTAEPVGMHLNVPKTRLGISLAA